VDQQLIQFGEIDGVTIVPINSNAPSEDVNGEDSVEMEETEEDIT
jgi:hypothetical protein